MEQELSKTIVTSIQPLLILFVGAIIAMILKETVASLVASLKWKMKPGFEPGDEVFFDGDLATIISIGWRETVFEITNSNGTVWRYVENTRMPIHRLEKIISKKVEK
jgi:hypothetical protein